MKQKTVTIELPIQEAMDVIRLLRAESACLIENGDNLPDIDVLKRAQHVLSARERIVSALECVAETEDVPGEWPQFTLGLDGSRMPEDGQSAADMMCEAVTTGDMEGMKPVGLDTLPESVRKQVVDQLSGSGIDADEVQVVTVRG